MGELLFLSYSSLDKEKVSKLAKDLENSNNIKVGLMNGK